MSRSGIQEMTDATTSTSGSGVMKMEKGMKMKKNKKEKKEKKKTGPNVQHEQLEEAIKDQMKLEDEEDVVVGEASEYKSKMLEAGMIPIKDVTLMTIKRSNKVSLIVISKPDVFKSQNSDDDETYVIFGEAKIDDIRSQQQDQAVEEDEVVDETGVNPEEIEFLMEEGGLSRTEAILTIKACDGAH